MLLGKPDKYSFYSELLLFSCSKMKAWFIECCSGTLTSVGEFLKPKDEYRALGCFPEQGLPAQLLSFTAKSKSRNSRVAPNFFQFTFIEVTALLQALGAVQTTKSSLNVIAQYLSQHAVWNTGSCPVNLICHRSTLIKFSRHIWQIKRKRNRMHLPTVWRLSKSLKYEIVLLPVWTFVAVLHTTAVSSETVRPCLF